MPIISSYVKLFVVYFNNPSFFIKGFVCCFGKSGCYGVRSEQEYIQGNSLHSFFRRFVDCVKLLCWHA